MYMNRVVFAMSVPRTRGDEPKVVDTGADMINRSPHARG